MECKVKGHKGIRVALCEKTSPHYAGAYCRQCGLWIKWLDADEAKALESGGTTIMEELREVAEEAGEDVRIPNDAHTRLIVRDELAKILQAMSDAIK